MINWFFESKFKLKLEYINMAQWKDTEKDELKVNKKNFIVSLNDA